MFRIYPYKVGSESVKKLKTVLDALIIKTDGSRYRYNPRHTIINWGNSRRPAWMTTDVPVLNKPEAVAIAGDKLKTFTKLYTCGISTVPFTTSKELAEDWASGYKVFARHSLTGHSGEGIEVIPPHEDNHERAELMRIARELDAIRRFEVADVLWEEAEEMQVTTYEVPNAPLYTRGVNNHGEYRVHVFNGSVILYQKKSRRVDEDGDVDVAIGEDADVRNLASNWVYRTNNLRRLERVEQLAINAVSALGLDFGAVDIIKDENGDVFVLEVNTAPGLGNTETLAVYVRTFNREPAELPDEVTTDV